MAEHEQWDIVSSVGLTALGVAVARALETRDDNGGVHINSGIPNRAFYLAATGIGGNSWEGAGRIWYAVLTGGKLAKDVDFKGFAQATIDTAGQLFGASSSQRDAVGDAPSFRDLGRAVHARFAALGGVDLPLPEREPMRELPDFDQESS